MSPLQVIFMFPETKWHRLHPSEIAASAEGSLDSKTDISPKETVIEDTTKPAANILTISRSQGDLVLGRGSPSRHQWGLYTPSPHALRATILDVWVPWKLFAFPIVELAAFIVSWSCSCLLTVNLTQSQNFAAPPYNFNSQDIGFFNFATLIGAFIGLATAGPLSDWVSARATTKNGGVREPEMRLPAMSTFYLRADSEMLC